MKVKLSEILEGMEFQNDQNAAYLNVKTGEVVFLTEDMIAAAAEDDTEDSPEWMQEGIEKAREICVEESPDYLQLPDRFEINEYRMMEDFIGTVENADHQRQLGRGIQGRGAFRRFKDVAGDLDLLDAWYAYRNEEYKRIAAQWCNENGLDYE